MCIGNTSFPAHNIFVFAFSSRNIVPPIGKEIIFTVGAGTQVAIRLSPGIIWQAFFEIGSIPTFNAGIDG